MLTPDISDATLVRDVRYVGMDGTSAVVLSGKGGVAKTLWQLTLAGEASRAGIETLLIDIDPERNLSRRFGVPNHAGGLGAALEAAGVTKGSDPYDVDVGAARLLDEIVPTRWPHVALLPAGASLTGVGQVSISDNWLLRDLLEKAGVEARYALRLLDTAGRSGSLAALAMYGADVAYAPIAPTMDAVTKAEEARERVNRIQRAHELRWAGVVLSGFDMRVSMDMAIRQEAYERFAGEIRAEVPRRANVHEAFQLAERLGDRSDVPSRGLSTVFAAFLHQHLLQDEPVTTEVAR
jgi:chromosome partitioning protein